MALLLVNGREYFIDVASIEVYELGGGSCAIQYDGSHQFLIVGGRKSGGASNEYFCHHPELYGNQWLPCKSKIEAIKLGAQY